MDLWAGQAHGGGAVLAVSSGVGEGIHVDGPDGAVLVGAQADMQLHVVAGELAMRLSSRV